MRRAFWGAVGFFVSIVVAVALVERIIEGSW